MHLASYWVSAQIVAKFVKAVTAQKLALSFGLIHSKLITSLNGLMDKAFHLKMKGKAYSSKEL